MDNAWTLNHRQISLKKFSFFSNFYFKEYQIFIISTFFTFSPNNLDIIFCVPYRAKLCRAKFSSGETIRRAKFSSLNEKFVTFARRKVSPNKSKSVLKWSTSEPTSDLSHLDKLWLHWWAKLCRVKFSSGETICRAKFSSLNEKFVTFARRKVSPNKNVLFENRIQVFRVQY